MLLFATPLAAQVELPLQMDRPNFATTGREAMPQMLIDEGSLFTGVFRVLPYPAKYWEQEKACVAATLGRRIADVGAPPSILVIPAVRTIRVRQFVLDSMLYAEGKIGEYWDAPTIAVAMIHSNYIIITAPFQANPYVLRHEALHFILWRLRLAPLGHPKEFFGPCDVNFEPEKK